MGHVRAPWDMCSMGHVLHGTCLKDSIGHVPRTPWDMRTPWDIM